MPSKPYPGTIRTAMNQDQVKSILLKLDTPSEEFSVVFTGKKSGKVDGLYHPDTREILIHNKNHADDNALLYTAIHEFAHHVHYTRSGHAGPMRVHNSMFWSIFHRLLNRAEELGLYHSVFKTDERFVAITKRIKEKFLSENGNLMKEFGKLLLEAHALCREMRVSFEDFIDRSIGIHRSAARQVMKVYSLDLNPEIGYDNMKALALIKDGHERGDAERAMLEGSSIDMVRSQYMGRAKPDSPLDALLSEKSRIEQSIEKLSDRLALINRKIREIR